MSSFVGDTVCIRCPIELITTNKRIKEQKLKEIVAAICALLNSNGGLVVLVIDTNSSSGKCFPSCQIQVSSVIRILEQTMISIIGIQLTVSNIHIQEYKRRIVILVKKADSLITTNYNLYLPSHTQVVLVPATEPPEKIIDITNRKGVLQAVILGSHQKMFCRNQDCGLLESKADQFKYVKSDASKSTRLADRITGKGNKFSCYVSAFANYNGGHIYYGIDDDRVVQGQFVSSEEDKENVTKKVEKAINKMIWPEQVGQPKQGEQWEIFFESVVDENSKPIPSTFVIVIYVAPCLGGVFTEEPECYEIVGGKVEDVSFATWRQKMLSQIFSWNKKEIPNAVECTRWSSSRNRNAFIIVNQELMQLIVNGNWKDISKKSESLVNKYHQLAEGKLSVLFKHITGRYRRGHFNEAQALLQKLTDILPEAKDRSIFEVLQLYLNAALKRASGDLVGLKEFLFAALAKAELIAPGLVPAIVYVFASTVTGLVKSEDQTTISPQNLSIKALQCLERVPDSSHVREDLKQKSHITLATFYLGFNISGQRIKDNEEIRLNEAKKSLMAVHESIYEGNALSRYREVQLNLVQSIYYYRYSQGAPDQRARYLRDALNYAKKAERLAKEYHFAEMFEWSETHIALWTEELLRTRLHSGERSHSSSDLTGAVKLVENTDSEEREENYSS